MPSGLDGPQMSEFLALSRRVKTQAGAQKFGQGIGEQIIKDAPKPKEARPVSAMRLRALRRMIDAAETSGDEAKAKELREEFQTAFRQFAKGKSLTQAAAYLGMDQKASG